MPPAGQEESREGIRLPLGHLRLAVTVAKASMAKFVADAEPMADARLAGRELDDAACSGNAKAGIHADAEVDDADIETQFASDLFDRHWWLLHRAALEELLGRLAAKRRSHPQPLSGGPPPALLDPYRLTSG